MGGQTNMAMRHFLSVLAMGAAAATCAMCAPTEDVLQNHRRAYSQHIDAPGEKTTGPNGYMRYYPGYQNGSWVKEYFDKRIVPGAFVGFVLLCLTLLSFFLCIFCRCSSICCSCCRDTGSWFGWCFNCCCGTGDPDPKGYTARSRSLLFGGVCLCTLVIIAAAAAGHVKGVQEVCGGSVDLFSAANTNVDQMASIMTIMTNSMTALRIGDGASDMTSAINGVKDQVSNLNTKVGDACKKGGNVEMGSQIYFAVFAVNTLWALCAYCCKKSCPAVTLTITGFILASFAWFLMTAFLGVGQFLDDTCLQLEYWHKCHTLKGVNRPAYCDDGVTVQLSQTLKCPDKEPFKKKYSESFVQLRDTLIPYYNTLKTAGDAEFALPNSMLNPQADYANFSINTLYRKQQYDSVGAVAATAACLPGSQTGFGKPDNTCLEGTATGKCRTDQPVIPTSATKPCSQRGILSSIDLMWGSSYVADCTYLTATAKAAVADGKACNRLGSGFFMLFAAHGAIALLYVIIVIITIHGYKVWSNPEEDIGTDEFYEEGEGHGPALGLQPPGALGAGDGGPVTGAKDKDFI